MDDSCMDLRIAKTKKAIGDALVELINEKGFEAITVKDITNKAGINRGTFYAHYQDKYDLMTKCEDQIMLEMAEIVKQDIQGYITWANSTSTSTFPFAVAIFKYLNENSGFMEAVLGPKGGLSFQTRLKNFMWKTMFESESEALLKEENLLVPGQYLVSYIASAHLGIIQQWLNNDRQESPEEMARILSTITVNGPFFAAGLKK
ncbi:MAG: TetR/AcrR family transcriptional regulator [Bacillota bacterium]